MLAQIIDVFKIRIGVLMAITTLAGLAVNPGEHLDVWRILLLALITLMASASAGAFNQYVECDLDARMRRTCRRPFVSGRFRRDSRWLWGISLLLLISVTVGYRMYNPAVAAYLFLGAFFYGVVYTLWLKRRSVWNIVIGGASGSFAVLVGAAAVNPQLNAVSILLAIVLFLWTPPHFWSLAIALHQDYARTGVPMLPVLYGDRVAARIVLINITLLVAASIVPFFCGLGWLYLSGAVSGGAYFLYMGFRLWRKPDSKTAMRCFYASLLQLTLILLTAIVDARLL